MLRSMSSQNDLSNDLVQVLESAENGVRSIMAAAANRGRYDLVDDTRRVALAIRSMRESLQPKQLMDAVPVVENVIEDRPLSEGRRPKVSYPHFELRRDQLIRTGWSKKKRAAYSHKVARKVFDRVVSLLNTYRGKSAPTQAEVWMKDLESADTEPVPSYQFYVVIGYLREKGYIKQVGREGYLVPEQFSAVSNISWAK